MSKELEIKCPSGATIAFTGVNTEEYFKGLDDATLLRALGECNNVDHGEDFEKFDLFEKQPKMKKQYSSKQRKIHKLKRENVVLGQKRRGSSNSIYIKQNKSELFSGDLMIALHNIKHWSEKIGKNSAKIQRLRTQIQQEKALDKL